MIGCHVWREQILERNEIIEIIRILLARYHASYAILFGSYARGEETSDSDIDLIVVGGEHFHPSDIFDFGEDLREMTGKDADVFEIREIERDTDFYRTTMAEGVKIAC